jgi:hypothetical protein
MTTDNDQVYIFVGAPRVYDQHGIELNARIASTVDNSGVELFISVTVPETKPTTIQQFMPGVTLTKPSIRVPVWGQEFVVQNVRLEKGQICVDVTPPVIKDQSGNVLPAVAWNNDVITVKAVPGSQYPDPNKRDNLAQTQKQLEKAVEETEKVRKDNAIWRENYRKEHERANKLQDDTAKAKRELTEENTRLKIALELAQKSQEKATTELEILRARMSEIRSVMTKI